MTNGPMEANRPTLLGWANRAQDFLRNALALQRPFFESPVKLAEQTEWLVSQLGIRCTLTSDSVLLLIGQLKFWDAEILARVALEGTFKLVNICSGTVEERSEKSKQFMDDMPEIARLRRHSRVEKLLSLVPNPGDSQWRPIRELLLTHTEQEELWARYPKRLRSQLEQAWSLPGLCEALARSGLFNGAAGLLHTYGMSSSLAHLDGDALHTMREREERSAERVTALELAHGARLLSDVMAYASLRSFVVLKTKALDLTPVRDLENASGPFRDELSKAAEQWTNVEYGEPAD